MVKNKLLLLSVFFISFSVCTQTTNEELGYYYYNEGDFEKAKMYLEKVYEQNSSARHYDSYLNTLLELEDCKEAEKLAKKQSKKYPRSINYMVGLGTVYDKCGNTDKADKHYQSIIDDLDNKTPFGTFSSLGREFTRLNKLDFALQTYQKGDQVLSRGTGFGLYIADILGRQGKHQEMMEAYLQMLDENPSQKGNVQTMLSRAIDFEDENGKRDLIRVNLLKKIQSNPSKTVFSQMLIWYFQQTNNFESAFVQVKALDKRSNAKGEEVYQFASLCISNKKFDLAIESYEYILENFTETNYYYQSAKRKILGVLNKKITENLDYSQADLSNLERRYVQTIQEVSNYREKSSLMLELANLEVYFLHKLDTAQTLLEDVLSYPGVDKYTKGKAKVAKADVMLIKNEVWDASLLYMQVEKEFKEDVLGHTAKFKNAKLYYYTGDYEWSQNQLNSLKASTSKLISNDAIDLSLLITDNYNMDTTTLHMNRFSQADLLIYQNKYKEALLKLDSINQEAPEHSLSDEILYKRYQIAFAKRKYEEAKTYLQKIVAEYGEDILADNALFYLGELYEQHLNNPTKAKEMYETLLFEYPGSLYVVEARKRYRAYSAHNKINIEE